jgi:membrane-associated phospholipid phosphatase
MTERIADEGNNGPMSRSALLAIFGGLLASAWLFGFLATEVVEGETHYDARVARSLHEHATAGWTDFFRFVTYLGNLVTLVIVLAIACAILWRKGRVAELQLLLLAAIGTQLLTQAFKLGFRRDRPVFPDPLATESTYSFPSGHASMSLAVYGTLAFVVARRLDRPAARIAVLTAAAVLIFLIGISRIYLGVHYVSDVVAGYCLALAWITACALTLELRRRRRAGAQTSRYLASAKQ